jgi:predicted RNase H-like HicB family nuclease
MVSIKNDRESQTVQTSNEIRLGDDSWQIERRYLKRDIEQCIETSSPDLPGCIATGTTVEETKKNIAAAISFHIDGLKSEGLPIPESESNSEYVTVS